MKIDRTTFVLLTAALAACSSTKADTTDAGSSSGGSAVDAAADAAADASEAADADDASSAADGDGGVCSDDVGTPADCAMVTCTAFATSQCEIYKSLFKPKVAQAAVECLKAGVGAFCPVYKCADDALNAACPDATASTVCAAMQTTCTNAGTPLAAGECEKYAQGLNAAGRTQLQMCDCKFGFYSCIEGL